MHSQGVGTVVIPEGTIRLHMTSNVTISGDEPQSLREGVEYHVPRSLAEQILQAGNAVAVTQWPPQAETR